MMTIEQQALALVTDTKPSDVDGLIEAMRDDPYMDDAHLLGTTTQDARMTHYAEIAAAHFSTTLAAQQARIEALTAALENVLPFVQTFATGCHGDKCRRGWCYSCYDEGDAITAGSRGLAAYQAARAALKEPS